MDARIKSGNDENWRRLDANQRRGMTAFARVISGANPISLKGGRVPARSRAPTKLELVRTAARVEAPCGQRF